MDAKPLQRRHITDNSNWIVANGIDARQAGSKIRRKIGPHADGEDYWGCKSLRVALKKEKLVCARLVSNSGRLLLAFEAVQASSVFDGSDGGPTVHVYWGRVSPRVG